MALLQFTYDSGTVALAGGTAQTVLQITAPANQRLKLQEIEIAFDGVNAANTPVDILICRQTTAGTFGTTLTAGRVNTTSSDEAAQAVGKTAVSVEPTVGDTLKHTKMTPNGGTLLFNYTFAQEDHVPGGGRVGVKLNAPQAVNCAVTLKYEE